MTNPNVLEVKYYVLSFIMQHPTTYYHTRTIIRIVNRHTDHTRAAQTMMDTHVYQCRFRREHRIVTPIVIMVTPYQVLRKL